MSLTFKTSAFSRARRARVAARQSGQRPVSLFCLGALLCFFAAPPAGAQTPRHAPPARAAWLRAFFAPAQTQSFLVSGRVTLDGAGFADVTIQVRGSVNTTVKTAADGSYSFTAPARSNLAVSPHAQFFDFKPYARGLKGLQADAPGLDFAAQRQLRSISGVATDDAGQALRGVTVKLLDSGGATLKTDVTTSSGAFSFLALPTGFSYGVEAAGTGVFSFDAAAVNPLTTYTKLTLQGRRNLYSISGRVVDDRGAGVGGATITLGPSGRQTTASTYGYYKLDNVSAGFEYTLSTAKELYDFDPATRSLATLKGDQSGVDFSGKRRAYEIEGLIRDGAGRPVNDFKVQLTAAGTGLRRLATTDDAGHFSFPEAPAGFSFTVAPLSTTVANFNARSFPPLTAALSLDITARRRLYTITGNVADANGPVPGVAISVQELPDRKGVTNVSGNYAIGYLEAGLPYTLTPATQDYRFAPERLTVGSLEANTELDFQALPYFTLGGRVTDQNGKGIFGVRVALSGGETGSDVTDADGNYSFLVRSVGVHTLTPVAEQGYYRFTPGAASLGGVKSRTVNFSAAPKPPYRPSHVLEFGGVPMTVDYGYFWDHKRVLGHFFWELWAMPDEKSSGGYMIADGYGGGHALLFGFAYLSGQELNHYQLSGNIWDGVQLNTFNSDEGPEPYEWGHFAVGWDGRHVITYFNGVPVGKKEFDGPRRTPGPGGGGSRLLVGGSDHSNFTGRIAQVRGYEERNPREGDGSDPTLPFAAFRPQTVFDREGSLLSYYFRPGDPITDLSPGGHDGKAHTGVRRGTKNGMLQGCDGCPVPQFVVDPTAPDFSNPDNPGRSVTPQQPPAPAPQGALVFDSFTRPNSTYILGGRGGLGATESGTLSPRPWQTNVDAASAQPFGILNGRAVLLANAASVAWVNPVAPSADLDVSVNRRPRQLGTGQNTGLSFRVLNASNYFFAYTSEGATQADPKRLTVGYYLNGVRTDLVTDLQLPNDWTTLRVETRADGRINVYRSQQLVFSTTSSVLANATGAGLYNNAPGLGLTNRWDNFTISVPAAP